MVRPGLMLYGVWPLEGPAPDGMPLRPVLRWETRVLAVRALPAGASIGYGRTYQTGGPARVAVLPAGYADGYRTQFANNADVLIRGKRCPVRGRVSMDQTVVDVSHVPGAAPGDTAVLLGAQGDEAITAAELATRAGTIPYDILTGIGRRVERVHVTGAG
jgi:alanine racemase